jgi:hypothetical protein
MSCYAPDTDETCCTTRRIAWLRPRWSGPRLAKKRFPLGERRWSMVWQQLGVPEDATFNAKAVATSINRSRQPGVMRAGSMGHRPNGMENLYVIGGLDPATVGYTAMIVMALDRTTGKRWILDGVNQAGMSPATLRDTVKRLTDQYGIAEWCVERNAFQRFLTQDPELNIFLRSRGCKMTEHYTTANKVDPDFGVMSLAPLFETTGEPPKNNGGGMWRRVSEGDLIELPDDRQSAWCSALVQQLIAWEPSGLSQRQKTDLTMALWFCEIVAKRLLSKTRKMPTHTDNPFASRGALRSRGVVNLREYREAALAAREAV